MNQSRMDFAPTADEVARRACFSYVNEGRSDSARLVEESVTGKIVGVERDEASAGPTYSFACA